MRHRKVGRKLKRTASHRKSTLQSLATALLQHKRIRTTVTKAKETRRIVEPIITRAKTAVANESAEKKNIHARREVARFIKEREIVQELFNTIAPKVANRPGGYTRVVKLGQRHGDGAEEGWSEGHHDRHGRTPGNPAPDALDRGAAGSQDISRAAGGMRSLPGGRLDTVACRRVRELGIAYCRKCSVRAELCPTW